MKLGSLLGTLAVLGAAALGYKAYTDYKKEHEDLEKDFNEFDEEFNGCSDDEIVEDEDHFAGHDDPNHRYTALNSNKEQFVDAAKNTFEAAKGMVGPAKEIAKNVADIISEKASDANVVANDYYEAARDKVSDMVVTAKEKLGATEEDAFDADEDETADDVIIDIDVSGNIREDE